MWKSFFRQNQLFGKGNPSDVKSNSSTPINNSVLVAYDNEDRSHTGNANETIIGTPLLIPANTMGANGHMRIEPFFYKVGTVGGFTIKQYLNTSTNIDGNEILICGLVESSSRLSTGTFRRIVNKNSLSIHNVYGNFSASSTDYDATNTARANINVDFSVNQYLITTVTLVNGADEAGYDYVNVFVHNP